MFRFLKVTGNSLSPFYQEGDFVLAVKVPFLFNLFSKFRQGDIMVLRHPYYGVLIKQVQWISSDGNQFYVTGTQPESTDSRQFGLVERKWVFGKVILHIQKPSDPHPIG